MRSRRPNLVGNHQLRWPNKTTNEGTKRARITVASRSIPIPRPVAKDLHVSEWGRREADERQEQDEGCARDQSSSASEPLDEGLIRPSVRRRTPRAPE